MNRRFALAASFAVALFASSVMAEGTVKSGPQVGKTPMPFNPLHVTGSGANGKQCLVWKHGNKPVAMIFAREVSDPLTSLVKKIDEATVTNKSSNLESFVVFLSDDENLKKQLKELAAKENIKNTVLTIDNPSGPSGYDIAKDADVTVVLYTKKNVKVNHAFKKGEMKAADVDKIVADIGKILPEKK